MHCGRDDEWTSRLTEYLAAKDPNSSSSWVMEDKVKIQFIFFCLSAVDNARCAKERRTITITTSFVNGGLFSNTSAIKTFDANDIWCRSQNFKIWKPFYVDADHNSILLDFKANVEVQVIKYPKFQFTQIWVNIQFGSYQSCNIGSQVRCCFKLC